MKKILVLNPNSSEAVTEKMAEGCAGIDLHPGHRPSFHTLAGGPAGIESQRDVESVVVPTCNFFLANPADAYVIGCFSDPGLALCREEIREPVVGIAEAAYREAAMVGRHFGVVSIKAGSIARHARAIEALGLMPRLAGDRALDLGVLELLDQERSIARVIEIGTELRDRDGADVLILGCATMGPYRRRIEAALGVAVVDPTQAGLIRASTLLSFGYDSSS